MSRGSIRNRAKKYVQNPVDPERSKLYHGVAPCSTFRSMTVSFPVETGVSTGRKPANKLDFVCLEWSGRSGEMTSFFIKSTCYLLTWKMKLVRKHVSHMRLGAQQGALIAPCSISCVPGPLHISWVAESALQ